MGREMSLLSGMSKPWISPGDGYHIADGMEVRAPETLKNGQFFIHLSAEFQTVIYMGGDFRASFRNHIIMYFLGIKLYEKSLPKLQFVYSKRKVSTKLFYAPKRNEKKFGPKYEATNE